MAGLVEGVWHKSSRSTMGDACIESKKLSDLVVVRDSKLPAGPVLTFSHAAWSDFLRAVCGDLTHGSPS